MCITNLNLLGIQPIMLPTAVSAPLEDNLDQGTVAFSYNHGSLQKIASWIVVQS